MTTDPASIPRAPSPPVAGAPPQADAHGAPERIGESLPPADPIEPVHARPIHWLLAVPASLPVVLFPKRLGPHAAASSWLAAYVVHLFAMGFTAGTVLAGTFAIGFNPQTSWLAQAPNPIEDTIAAFAANVLFVFTMWNRPQDILPFIMVVAIIEALMWLAAVPLIPLYAAGENRRRLYFRCVKLGLWASACMVPIMWLLPRVLYFWPRVVDDNLAVALFIAVVLWCLTVVFRLGQRFGGPAEGPRWESQIPRCQACGYTLTALPRDALCPECARPVADSRPTCRDLPAFAKAGWFAPFAFVRTTWRSMHAKSFAQHLAVWRGHREARMYAVWVSVLVAIIVAIHWSLLVFVLLDIGEWIEPNSYHRWPIGPRVFYITQHGLGAGVVIGLSSAALCLVGGLLATGFGFTRSLHRVAPIFYATGWIPVIILLAMVGWWLAFVVILALQPLEPIWIPGLFPVDTAVMIHGVFHIPAAAALVYYFLRLRIMLRWTRYANA